jgi:hypothetical protein
MASLDMSKFKPGQNLVCTISKAPATDDQADTIARLMRLDPETKRALRRAQRMRRQRMIVYNRGNRDWYSREKSAKIVHIAKGESWTMPYSHDLASSLERVTPFVTIKAG